MLCGNRPRRPRAVIPGAKTIFPGAWGDGCLISGFFLSGTIHGRNPDLEIGLDGYVVCDRFQANSPDLDPVENRRL